MTEADEPAWPMKPQCLSGPASSAVAFMCRQDSKMMSMNGATLRKNSKRGRKERKGKKKSYGEPQCARVLPEGSDFAKLRRHPESPDKVS